MSKRALKFRDVRKNKKTGEITFYYYTLNDLWEKDSWQGEVNYLVIATDQFTGLKDRDGVEIYANDYCRKPDGTIIFIAWNNYGFKVISVEIVDGKKLRIPLGNLGNYLSSNCEIIGNIHEEGQK